MKKTFLSILTIFLFICNSYAQDSEELFSQANEKCIAHDYLAALKLYDESITINPKYDLAYYNRGITKLNLSDTKGACIDLKKAKELGYKKVEETISKFCNEH